MASDPKLAGEAFNFSTERPLSVLDVVELLQQAAGTDLEPDIRNEASSEIPEQHLSAARAREILGWQPAWTVEEAMAETVGWYRENIPRGIE
jgi:CDP-glucose 4,6-dehydratase